MKLKPIRKNSKINSPGIYQIESFKTDRRYIGSTVNLSNRVWCEHYYNLLKGKHSNKHLQNHVNKYGILDLRFDVVEFCSKEKLIEREQHYINILKPEFNLLKVAGSTLGFKHSEEARKKMSEALKGKSHSKEHSKKISEANKGKIKYIPSEEIKKKISQTLKGRILSDITKKKMSEAKKGKPLSKETRNKMSEAHKNKHTYGGVK